jgi:transcriptional regulator with XRE-family HTH domain
MPRSTRSPRHQALIQILTEKRIAAGMTQVDVALKLKRPQSFVSKYESGERRLDVIELIEVCEELGIKAVDVVATLTDHH